MLEHGDMGRAGHKFASSENARPPAQLFFFRLLTHFRRHRHRDATHIPWGPGMGSDSAVDPQSISFHVHP